MAAVIALTTIEASRDHLLAAIGPAPEMTFVRGPGNRGDELILAGTRALLSGHVYHEVGVDELTGVEGELALISGGGAWARAYHEHMPALLGILEQRFERVIVLPSSFEVEEDSVRDALISSGATFFAREAESYARISGLCRAEMAHDCAFYYDFEPHRQEGHGTLEVFRTDAESLPGRVLPDGNDDISATSPSFERWLETIARHERVRTDRAHVMIAAAMLGKQVRYAPTSTSKQAALAATLPPWADVDAVEPPPVAPRAEAPPAPAFDRARSAADALPRPRHLVPSADGSPRVCAVVLTRNRPAHVARSVRSILSAGDGVRVVLIDHNTVEVDREPLRALAADEPRVSLLLTDRNPGCAAGRQMGVGWSEEELLLFLDDDAELLPGALGHLVADIDAHPEAVAVAAHVLQPDGRTWHCGGTTEIDGTTARFFLGGNDLDFEDATVPATGPSDWVPGTAMLIRRSALETVPFDPAYDSIWDDNDWSLRATAAFGPSLRRCREALAFHHFGPRPAASSVLAFRAATCRRLAVLAGFLETHGLLLDVGGRDADALLGDDPEPAETRLLLRYVAAVGAQQLLADWHAGDLGQLMAGRGRRREQARAQLLAAWDHEVRASAHAKQESERADAANARAEASERRALGAEAYGDRLEAELDAARRANDELAGRAEWLQSRHETLMAIESGRWWRLRGALRGLTGRRG